MSDERPQDELTSLLSAAVDHGLTSESLARLQALLRSDSNARQKYVSHMLLDSLLTEKLAAESVVGMVDLLGHGSVPDAAGETPKSQRTGGLPADSRRAEVADTHWRRLTRVMQSQVGWIVAAALLIGIMVSVTVLGQPEASAELLLTEARRVHSLPLDRCYVVELPPLTAKTEASDVSTAAPAGILELAIGRVDRLWIRGDQFFIESSNKRHRWVWGMDETGTAWLTFDPHLGLKLESDELPVWLGKLSEVLSMRFETLLTEVLHDFELSWESPDVGAQTRVVRAVRTEHSRLRWLQEAQLEIDIETKVLQRITVIRSGRFAAPTTVTYRLAATAAQPDLKYQIEGHLEEPFVILSRDHQPERRAEILSRLFGKANQVRP